MLNRYALLAACLLALVTIAVSAAPENIVFILDASNSMNKLLGENSRLNVAKDALVDLLGVVSTFETAGLYAYGHNIDKDNEASCQDIEAIYPLLPQDAADNADVIAAIQALRAKGKTPIEAAMIEAYNVLAGYPTEGVIVLITDGEETCGGDPDEVARMIADHVPDITLHVVGLDVDAGVRDILTQYAGLTGGTYYGVGAAEGLLEALYQAVDRSRDMPVGPVIPSEYACLGITNVIVGTEGDDVLYGTPEGDLILGLGGNDFLMGLEGNDILVGGPGNDILEGVSGDDYLYGNEGEDLMFGGVGDDILCGGSGADSLEGDSGNDILDGGEGVDILLGGKGNDLLYSADVFDTLMEGKAIAGAYERCQGPCPVVTRELPVCPPPVVERQAVCPPPLVVEPVVECPPTAIVKTLNEGESIQLHGTVGDADCNIVQHLWQASAGSFDDATSLHPVFTAPMLAGCDNLDVEIVLTAVDSCGASASDSFIIHVLNVNHPPMLELGEPIVIDEGSSVTLLTNAVDCDGDALSAQWTVQGVGMIEGASVLQAVFVAPMIDACDGIDVLVSASVLDPCGASACDTVMIHIRNVNGPPTVDLGPDFALDECTAIQLTPIVADPDNEELHYCWSVSGGSLSDSSAAEPIFNAPLTAGCGNGTVVITLTVTDACGLYATDSITVCVKNVNSAPTVDLGPDLCVLECDTLLITPVTSDPDGDLLSYTWSASGGYFTDSCSAVAIYSAPQTDNCEGEDVVLTLTVTDACGLTATDSIVVHIQNVNQPPTVHADP